MGLELLERSLLSPELSTQVRLERSFGTDKLNISTIPTSDALGTHTEHNGAPLG